jgi:hypothetical protein
MRFLFAFFHILTVLTFMGVLHRSRGESKLPTASSFPSRTVKLASVPDYSTASSELVSEGLERKRMKDSKLV